MQDHPFKLPDKPGADGSWRTHVIDLSKKEKRKQIAANSYEELLDKLMAHYGMLSEPKTLEPILEEFLEDKARTKKQATISRDRRTWKRYLAGTELVRTPLERLEGYEIKVWIENLIKSENLSVHEYSNLKTVVNQMLKYAARNYIENDPLCGIEIDTNMLKQDRKAPGKTQRYVKREMERVMAVAWEDFNARNHRIHQLSPLFSREAQILKN